MQKDIKNQIIAMLCNRQEECIKLQERAFQLSLNIFCKDKKSLNRWKRVISIYSHYVEEIKYIDDLLNYISKY